MEAGEGLYHEALLPLAWRALPELPGPEMARQETEAAREVLRSLLTLALGPGEATDDVAAAGGGERGGELLRLERKLDLVLELLGRLLIRAENLPPLHKVRLSAETVLWQSDEIPSPGPVAVELHLDLRYPLPLCLSGNAQVDGDQVRVDFASADPTLRDALERLIFLLHRRRLGRERRPSGR
ncbi:MAG TPA: PilZ domain-containing protein [Plasticicumulans sp.]|uniref:PilZ domain-containing protein n=1 Tax=Plasticicumulans sp. TaxID=2307179 RepID=UPI000F921A71|nr:PilZ domain-containing protein [Plasticicumulans sp.]RTL05629.1 MAG: hypothetical protein EKK65_00960 [Xanthomonadales bacterium]HMV39999.1 PilZ domain-containing protein [Plasticicumulans sp.]HND97381.1 PilZ domain-containing protein [Plasticicumulans sp.]HNG48656.1 PilZ domain-containing protein [Plasticicumulans sp.]HNI22003.1 PilZ domain-containing protein [Plasticicumulans sp.]